MKIILTKILGYGIDPKQLCGVVPGKCVKTVQKEDLYLTKGILAAIKNAITKNCLKPDYRFNRLIDFFSCSRLCLELTDTSISGVRFMRDRSKHFCSLQ